MSGTEISGGSLSGDVLVDGTTGGEDSGFALSIEKGTAAEADPNSLELHFIVTTAGAIDYRTVDIPGPPTGGEVGDAWIDIFVVEPCRDCSDLFFG